MIMILIPLNYFYLWKVLYINTQLNSIPIWGAKVEDWVFISYQGEDMKLGMQSSSPKVSAGNGGSLDFDEEARKLWERLGIGSLLSSIRTHL